jgi:hypothetical protein
MSKAKKKYSAENDRHGGNVCRSISSVMMECEGEA